MYIYIKESEKYIYCFLVVWQATSRLPSAADLSDCYLDYLPENLFVNTELEVLNLRANCLCEQPTVELVSNIGWLDSLTRCVAVVITNIYHLDKCTDAGLMDLCEESCILPFIYLS